jgi:hypothetical protein
MTCISSYVLSLLANLNTRNQPEPEARIEDIRMTDISLGISTSPRNLGESDRGDSSIDPPTLDVSFGTVELRASIIINNLTQFSKSINKTIDQSSL